MFDDPQFWVFIAFVIFIIAVFKPVRKILISGLDNNIKKIIDSIDQAEKLKNEAQKTLNELKERQNDVKKEIQSIQNEAKERITLIEQLSKQKLNDQIKKRNELVKVKIEQMTRDANLQVQQYILQNAITATIVILEKKLNQSEQQRLIDQSIEELSSILKH